jgi:hypothetical protein
VGAVEGRRVTVPHFGKVEPQPALRARDKTLGDPRQHLFSNQEIDCCPDSLVGNDGGTVTLFVAIGGPPVALKSYADLCSYGSWSEAGRTPLAPYIAHINRRHLIEDIVHEQSNFPPGIFES